MNAPLPRPAARRRARAGFTLIEIMVVIAIIGLLATFVAPYAIREFRKSSITVTKTKMATLKGVLESYRMQYSRVPDSLEELLNPDEKNLNEPWIDSREQIRDAWGNDFRYERLSNKKYDIISLGADGLEGGDADDADIHSAEDQMPGG